MKQIFILDTSLLTPSELSIIEEKVGVLRKDTSNRLRIEIDIFDMRGSDLGSERAKQEFSLSPCKGTLYLGLQWIGCVEWPQTHNNVKEPILFFNGLAMDRLGKHIKPLPAVAMRSSASVPQQPFEKSTTNVFQFFQYNLRDSSSEKNQTATYNKK